MERFGADPRRPVVLESVRSLRPTTNPYLVELLTRLSSRVDVKYFNWRTALFGRYDLLHLHWPELLFLRSSRLKRWTHSSLLLLLLGRLSLTRIPIVRTLHNVKPHELQSRLTDLLLELLDRRTSLWIVLNAYTPAPVGAKVVLIPHPHYREWFDSFARAEPVRGRVGFVGQVRPYKNVDRLIVAFSGVHQPDATLSISGSVRDRGIERQLRDLAGADERIDLDLSFVSDADLVDRVTSSQILVLPYSDLDNSGALLLALSLGRPVLVPDTEQTRALEAEVGAGWVHRFAGELNASTIQAALESSDSPPADAPDLSGREWPAVVDTHEAEFREVMLSRTARRTP